MLGKDVMQCMKCRHLWEPEEHTRKDGTPRTRCPHCNGNSVIRTRRIITKVRAREDLLMLTDEQYPKRYCPRTSYEELYPEVIEQVGEARLMIGRGFENPKEGHKALLYTKRGHTMDTNYNERQSMKGAVAWCPLKAKVFIGGLGLGLILLYLAKTHKSKEVTICEIDPDVIKLVEPRLRRWFDAHYPDFSWKVIQGDALQEVLKEGPYDWVFMDIWKHSNEIELMQRAEEVAKRNLTARGRVTCWMKSTYEREQRRYRHWKREGKGLKL